MNYTKIDYPELILKYITEHKNELHTARTINKIFKIGFDRTHKFLKELVDDNRVHSNVIKHQRYYWYKAEE